MNTEKFLKEIQTRFSNIELKVTEMLKERIVLKGSIVAEKFYDDGVLLEIIAYESGTAHLFLTFDRIIMSEKNLMLVNKLNEETSWLKAYLTDINDCTYLQIHYALYSSNDEETTASFISDSLEDLLSDHVVSLLKPLTEITQ